MNLDLKLNISKAEGDLAGFKSKLANAMDEAEVKQLKTEIDKLTKSLHEMNVQAGEMSLDKRFDEIYGEVMPLTTALGELEDRLYQLALEGKKDSEEFRTLVQEAGRYRAVIIETDRAVDLFGESTGFQRASTAAGEVGDALLNWDFVGAERRAQGLQEAMSRITPEEVEKQMNALKNTFSALGKVSGQMITGMVKNVGMMAKSFMSFGVSLLANPIFLIAIAIIAIVTIIGLLLNKLGLLKPILNVIGEVFGWIGDVIDAVVQSIKDFLDWLGLTDYAAEDSARKQTKAAEAKADAYEKNGKRMVQTLDEQIKITQIEGKRTVEMEIQKQKVIRQTAQLRLEALKAKYEENKLTEEMDEEELKALHEKIDAQRELIRTSNSEIRVIKAQDKADQKKDALDSKKEAEDNAKEQAGKAKQYRADRLTANRQLRDLELASMAEGLDKSIAINNEKYKRLLEDTKSSEKLTATEKKKIKDNYEREQITEENQIRKTQAEKEKKEQEETLKKQEEFFKVLRNVRSTELSRSLNDVEEVANQTIKSLRDNATSEMLASQEFADILLEVERKAEADKQKLRDDAEKTRKENEKKAMDDRLSARIDLLTQEVSIEQGAGGFALEATHALLAAQMDMELSNAELTEQQKADIKEKFRKQNQNADIDAANQSAAYLGEGLNAIQGLSDSIFANKMSKLEKGTAAEEQAAKRQFEINKKLQIAQAVVQGVQAVLAAYSSGSAIPVVGAVTGPVFAALAAVAAAANISKIKNSKFGDSSASPSVPSSSGAAANISAATPSANIFGNANQFNNVDGTKSVEKEKEDKIIVVKAVVAADEMTAKQMENNSIIENASL